MLGGSATQIICIIVQYQFPVVIASCRLPGYK